VTVGIFILAQSVIIPITVCNKKVAVGAKFFYTLSMRAKEFIAEAELPSLARKYRIDAGRNRAQAARELMVARQSIIYAEDRPEKSFLKLRCRIIEAYSPYRVKGPVFLLERKK
jgi:DNA-binding XRE family transcriptional regulator